MGVTDVLISSDNARIISSYHDRTITVWVRYHNAAMHALSFHPVLKRVQISTGSDGLLCFFYYTAGSLYQR